MRNIFALLLIAIVFGSVSGCTVYRFDYTDDKEMKPGGGIFTGKEGAWTYKR